MGGLRESGLRPRAFMTMKQILQSLKTGATEVAEVPCPHASAGQLLIRTARSLISAGTERMP